MTTADDRQTIIDGYRTAFGENPALPVAQLLHAVAIIETGFGRGWQSEAGLASNNLWAAQYKTPHQLGMWSRAELTALEKKARTSVKYQRQLDALRREIEADRVTLYDEFPQISPDGRGFLYTDTSPNADGTSTPYSVYFQNFPSVADACEYGARLVYKILGRDKAVLAPALRGDTYGFSAGMYATGYYQGFGPDAPTRIANHHKAITRALNQMARELNEPLPGGGTPPPPTIKRGSHGEAVRDWQRILGVVADGMFGPDTERATKIWQDDHGLDPDGIVGPATWSAAEDPVEADTEPPQEPTLSDVWLTLGQLATKEDMAALRKATGDVADELLELRKALEGDELVNKVVRRVVQQLGNGAG